MVALRGIGGIGADEVAIGPVNSIEFCSSSLILLKVCMNLISSRLVFEYVIFWSRFVLGLSSSLCS